MLARTDGDSSPGSTCSEVSVADETTEETLFFRRAGTSLAGVCGRTASVWSFGSGHSVVGLTASRLVGFDNRRMLPSFGDEVTEESKLRDRGRLPDENEAVLFLRLGTSTLFTCNVISMILNKAMPKRKIPDLV
jgi:hypothetical protein